MPTESPKKLPVKEVAAAMFSAIRMSEIDTVRALLDAGFELDQLIDEPGADEKVPCMASALHWAAAEGDVAVVRLLIERGAAVDARASNGSTPLHWVACDGNLEVCKALVDAGATVDAVDHIGDTPLYCAINNSDGDQARYLVSVGARIDSANENGLTPLHAAVISDDEEVGDALVKFFIGSGASSSFVPDNLVPDSRYLTPFQYALFFSNPFATRIMFDRCGEDPHQVTVEGRTMDELVEYEPGMAQLLRSMRTEFSVRVAMTETTAAPPVKRKRSLGMAL